jgi:hypothetical protein
MNVKATRFGAPGAPGTSSNGTSAWVSSGMSCRMP